MRGSSPRGRWRVSRWRATNQLAGAGSAEPGAAACTRTAAGARRDRASGPASGPASPGRESSRRPLTVTVTQVSAESESGESPRREADRDSPVTRRPGSAVRRSLRAARAGAAAASALPRAESWPGPGAGPPGRTVHTVVPVSLPRLSRRATVSGSAERGPVTSHGGRGPAGCGNQTPRVPVAAQSLP